MNERGEISAPESGCFAINKYLEALLSFHLGGHILFIMPLSKFNKSNWCLLYLPQDGKYLRHPERELFTSNRSLSAPDIYMGQMAWSGYTGSWCQSIQTLASWLSEMSLKFFNLENFNLHIRATPWGKWKVDLETRKNNFKVQLWMTGCTFKPLWLLWVSVLTVHKMKKYPRITPFSIWFQL